MLTGMICHCSCGPNGRVPFDAIVAGFRGMHATKLCESAFLEFMQPDFASLVDALVVQRTEQIRVIPLLLAAGATPEKT